MPKENDLEGVQDEGGKRGGQKGMPKPEPKPANSRDPDIARKGTGGQRDKAGAQPEHGRNG